MARKFDWTRAREDQALRQHEAGRSRERRYTAALTPPRNPRALLQRRNIAQRLACLCPDRRRDHPDAPCPHLNLAR